MSTTTPRLTIVNNSIPSHNHPNTTTTATMPIPRSTIDDFREIVREQSFVTPSNSNDVPMKRYPPLPDISIPAFNQQLFRTETLLSHSKPNQTKKQIFNHFAPPTIQRACLPTLNKQLQTISNMMDLDEDLPQCHTNSPHRAATYTSPGERIVSPIKRPSAPSPPTSAQIKRLTETTFLDGIDDDDDDEESQLFNDHFYHYPQPIIMPNRRIDHYNHQAHYLERNPAIIINHGHEELAHPLDSDDFHP